MSFSLLINDKNLICQRFLELPSMLYSSKVSTQDDDTEMKLLYDKHVLSKYFEFIPFVVVDDASGFAVSRCALTYYPDNDIAYFGFFESIDNYDATKLLLDCVFTRAQKDKKTKVVGPVDASFWIRYGLKTDKFDCLPYLGKPYNKEYYFKFLTLYGFGVNKRYALNTYKAEKSADFPKYYKKFIDSGYEIKSLTPNDYEYTTEKIYELLIDTPDVFSISKEDFKEIFRSYKYLLNPNMVKVAYYENEIKGYLFVVPNYHNLPYDMHIVNIIKMLMTRIKPSEYVIRYIGTFAGDELLVSNYADGFIKDRYEYVLLEKAIVKT